MKAELSRLNYDNIDIQLTEDKLQTLMLTTELRNINKTKVFEGRLNLLALYSDVISEQTNVFAQKHDDLMTIDEFRKDMQKYTDIEEINELKTKLMTSILSYYYQVQEGKVYDTPINPLNFLIKKELEKDGSFTVTLKSFFRYDKNIDKVDNEWLSEVLKLVIYSITDSTEISSSNYADVSISEILKLTNDEIIKVFNNIVGKGDLKGMLEMILQSFQQSEREELRGQIFSFRAISPDDYPKPKNLINLNGITEETEEVKEETDNNIEKIPESTEEGNKSPHSDKRELKEQKRKDRKEKKEKEKNERRKRINNQKENKPVKKDRQLNKKRFIPLLIIGILSIACIILLINLISSNNKVKSEQNKLKSHVVKKGNVEINKNLVNGLKYSSVQDYTKASEYYDKYFEQSKSKNIPKEYQLPIFFSYMYTGDYNKALERDKSDRAGEILVRYLKNKENVDSEVPKIKSKTPAIEFEKAVLNKDYKKILELSDKVKVDDVEDRQYAITEAYVKDEKLDNAISFAKETGNKKLIDGVKGWELERIDDSKLSKKEKDKAKKNAEKDIEKKIKDK